MDYKFYIKTVMVASLGITALNSCVKSDDFSVPPITCRDVFPATNHVLADLESLAKDKPTENDIIKDDFIVEGYVSSSDISGNIYKTLYVQDKPENPTFAIEVDIDGANQSVNYPLGSKIRINLKGLIVQESNGNGNIKVGAYDPSYAVGRINPNRIGDYIARVCSDNGKALIVDMVPLVFDNISDALQPEHINKLITIKNVQFEDGELGKTFSDSDRTGDRYITDPTEGRLDLRFSNYANFSTQKIEGDYAKSGDITVILSRYNSTYQAYLRDLQDIKFSNDRFEVVPVAVQPPSANAVQIFKAANFENWSDFLSSLNSFGLQSYAKQGIGLGYNGTHSLHIEGTPGGNDYVFTSYANANIPTSPKRITFYIKGIATGKSLSFNVYKAFSGFNAFNLGNLTSDTKFTVAENNQYNGSIDTKGKWVLVELNLSGLNVNTTEGKQMFALKVGNGGNYNLDIDNITIE